MNNAFAALSDIISKLDDQLPIDARLAVNTSDIHLFFAVLFLCRKRGQDLILFRDSFQDTFIQDQRRALNVHAVVSGTSESPLVETFSAPMWHSVGGIGIYSSGTTGLPKLAWHAWDAIQAPAAQVPERLQGKRWLLTYNPSSYAGLQVIFSAANNRGELVYLGSTLAKHPEGIIQNNVEIISATPTYWRMLINHWPSDLKKPALLQATLGGEVIRQDVLDLIRQFFAPARITHIYASTEAGTALVISDGLEGFPAEFLDRPGKIMFRIRANRLEISAPGGMRGYATADGGMTHPQHERWYTTPDRVEVRNGRVYFLGRDDRTINVAGTKVNPEQIEELLNSLPGIADSYVYGRPNPITGMLLCADILPIRQIALDVAQLQAELRARLALPLVPRIINLVETIQTTANGKKYR